MSDTPETERDEAQRALVKARDRAWKLACERSRWKLDCLEQAKLLARSADREEKLRTDLMLARNLADAAMWEADRLRAQLRKERP